MASDELVYFGLGSGMEILEFMHCLKFDHVESIRQDPIGFAFQQMLRLVGSNVRDRGEYISTMSGGALNTIAVIDASFACLVIDVKILEVIVKINASGAKIASEKSCMGGKDGRDIDVSLPT